VLFGCGVALVVEVVQQAGGGVKLDQRRAFRSCQSQPVGFCLAAGRQADFNGQRMLAQALALGPLGEQLPCLFSSKSRCRRNALAHFYRLLLIALVRVSLGFPG
jgi:hypothetical protein